MTKNRRGPETELLTIEELEATKVTGVFAHDQRLMSYIDTFMLSDAPMLDKLRAIILVDRITGCPQELNEAAVIDHIDYLRENGLGGPNTRK